MTGCDGLMVVAVRVGIIAGATASLVGLVGVWLLIA